MVTVSSGEICRYPENGLGAEVDAPGALSANAEKPMTRLEPAAAAPMRNDRRDGAISCARSVNAWSFMLRLQQLGGFMDSRADALVGVAAANVSAHPIVNVLIRRFTISAQQTNCGHHLAGLAITTLRNVELSPNRLDNLGDFSGNTFDGHNVPVSNIRETGLTGARRLTVDMDRACAAQRLTAAVFRADKPQIIPKNPKQRLVRISVNLSRLTIEGNAHRGPLLQLRQST